MGLGLNERRDRLQGAADDGFEFQSLFAESHLALTDAVDVKQIVNEPHHLVQLAAHHAARLLQHGAVSVAAAQEFQGIAQRGEWVAQFMRQCRQELVLVTVSFPERLGQRTPALFAGPKCLLLPLALGNVHVDAHDAHGLVLIVLEDIRPGFQPVNAAIGPDDPELREILPRLKRPPHVFLRLGQVVGME